MLELTWDAFQSQAKTLASYIQKNFTDYGWGFYGIPTGGCFVAMELAKHIKAPLLEAPTPKCIVVDDLVDSGKTMDRFKDYRRVALFRKPHSPKPSETAFTTAEVDGWIKFPWETSAAPEDAVVRLLEFIGENPKREGLVETPGRVTRAYKEMTSGYQEDPKQILSKVFDEQYDEVVILKGCPFTSLCEHHLLSFTGTVDVGYLPGKVVGLSKLARLVECFSKRLQVQERMTKQIADALSEHLQARGVAVVVKANHSCMACRGVKKPGTLMITSSMLGAFRDKPEARAEFLNLCRGD